MPRPLLAPLAFVALIVAALTVHAADKPARKREKGGNGKDFVAKQVEATGVKVGAAMPDVKVHQLDGKVVDLSTAWHKRPVMLVTASVTCPIAQNQCPSVALKKFDFSKYVDVVLLYTIEAHPNDGKSPYEPFKGQKRSSKYEQPSSLDRRLEFAKVFHEELPATPMLVDNMKDEAWKAIGSGPNVAIVIAADGKVIARQAWFDAEKMIETVKKLPEAPAAAK